MTEYTWADFDEIFGLPKIIDSSNYQFYIELSFNHPPIKKFMQLDVDKQKDVYNLLIYYLKLHIEKEGVKFTQVDSEFEFCGSSKLHYHGLFRVEIDKPYCVHGFIMDIVRIIKSQMVYSHKNINEKKYYDFYRRFKDNMLCVQYNELEPRKEAFLNYIAKTR